ncbi:hypothetical protein FHG87_020246 [Trinorchestia longiramus]|nr:hypothetical protein FHG87_020246 [Trinorchestia longiramus]
MYLISMWPASVMTKEVRAVYLINALPASVITKEVRAVYLINALLASVITKEVRAVYLINALPASVITNEQDSAPAHGAKKAQEWLKPNDPDFISKEKWSPSSLDLNPFENGIWSTLESKVSVTNHQNSETRKSKLEKEWTKILQKVIRDSCWSFSKRLQLVIDIDRGYTLVVKNCVNF